MTGVARVCQMSDISLVMLSGRFQRDPTYNSKVYDPIYEETEGHADGTLFAQALAVKNWLFPK